MELDHHNLSVPVVEGRHFPIRNGVLKRRRTTNHIIRSTAKRLAEWKDPKTGEQMKMPPRFDTPGNNNKAGTSHPQWLLAAQVASPNDVGRRRARLEKDIRSIVQSRDDGCHHREQRMGSRVPHSISQDETTEGKELARSDVPLPCDRYRLVRTPSLEREEAFRIASTAKGNVQIRHAADDAQVAELYSLGLLYDERDHEEVFDLNSIRHEEPVYTVRTTKRGRKGGKKPTGCGNRSGPLNMSFTDLGEDKSIAQYTMSPPGAVARLISDEAAHQQTGPESAPLRVMYELAGSNPSFDVDTSQPPDLMADIASDYECFSESDLEDTDTPSQREVQETTSNLHCDTWIILG